VSKLNVKKGERVVGTSQFSGTEMLRIADFKAMEARVDVSENDIVRVSMNDTALVDIDAYPDRKFKGVVTQIASSAGSTSQLQAATNQITNFTVKIRLLPSSYLDLMKKSKLPFRPGMSCSADIQTETIDKALAVPIQAVTTREDTLKAKINPNLEKSENRDDLKELVFVLNNNMVMSREVTVGLQDESYIQILSGLKGGEEVISAPYRVISKELKDSLMVEKVSKEELYKKEE
jgi:HlyD family secretion protein